MTELRKALFRALEKSDLNMLRAVLAQGVSLSYEIDDLHPVFIEAINFDRNELAILDALKAAGANPRLIDRGNGDSVVHWAIGREKADILNWFLNEGLEIDSRNSRGLTPLMSAIHAADWSEECPQERANGHRDVRLLLDAGANICLADKAGRTPLHEAGWRGLSTIVSWLLALGAPLETKDSEGATALTLAVHAAKPEAVSLLLAAGADVDATDTEGKTALHRMAELEPDKMTEDHAAITRTLIAAGADFNTKDEIDNSIIYAAAFSNNVTLARVLIEAGYDFSDEEPEALHAAVNFEYDELVEVLLHAGLPSNAPWGMDRTTPLHVAAEKGHVRSIDALLENGAKIDAQDIDGETPLLVAVRRQKHDAVECLLRGGANRHHTDHYGNTALGWAQRRGDARLIELLSE